MSDTVSLGKLFLGLEVNPNDYYTDLDKAKRYAFEIGREIEAVFEDINLHLTPTVDDKALTKLNKHLDLKVKHFKQVDNMFDGNPLTPKVDLTDLDKLTDKLKEIETAYTSTSKVINAGKLHPRTGEAASGEPARGFQSESSGYKRKLTVKQEPESALSIARSAVIETATESLTESVIRETGPRLQKYIDTRILPKIPNAARQKAGLGLDDKSILEREEDRKVEAYFTDAEAKRFSRHFSHEFELAGERLARRGFKAASKGDVGGVFGAIGSTVAEIPKSLLRATAEGVGELIGRRIGDEFAGEIEAGLKNARSVLQEFDLDARKARNVKQSAQRVDELARKRAMDLQIQQGAQDNNVLFYSGGFASKQGQAGIEAAPKLQEMLGDQVKVIGFANTNFDTMSDAATDPAGWARDVATNIADLAAKGYNEDSVKLASEVAAYKRVNPDAKVSLAGHSAGGLIAQEAAAILEEMGITDIKTLTLGTPNLALVPQPKHGNVRQIMGRGDAFSGVPALAQGQEMIDAAGHESGKYFESAEFQAILKDLTAPPEMEAVIEEAKSSAEMFAESYQAMIAEIAKVAEVDPSRIPGFSESKDLGDSVARYFPKSNEIKVGPEQMKAVQSVFDKQISQLSLEQLGDVMSNLSTVAHESFHGGQFGFSGLTTDQLINRGNPFVGIKEADADEQRTGNTNKVPFIDYTNLYIKTRQTECRTRGIHKAGRQADTT